VLLCAEFKVFTWVTVSGGKRKFRDYQFETSKGGKKKHKEHDSSYLKVADNFLRLN